MEYEYLLKYGLIETYDNCTKKFKLTKLGEFFSILIFLGIPLNILKNLFLIILKKEGKI